MACKKELAIYGVGGLGREIASMIEKINKRPDISEDKKWNLIGFYDDGMEIGEPVSHFGKVIGGIDQLNSRQSPIDIVLCFGSPATLQRVHQKITNPLVSFPNIIDPGFVIDDPKTFSIGHGNIIKGRSAVTTNVRIGNFNMLNGNVIIGHDTTIGDYNVMMWGVHVSGEVSIDKRNLLGTFSFIKQRLKVGDDVTLSPLSALLTKPKDGGLYIGNPAKIFRL